MSGLEVTKVVPVPEPEPGAADAAALPAASPASVAVVAAEVLPEDDADHEPLAIPNY